METTSCASKNQLPMKQAAPASSYRAYPAPLAKYEEVAMDSKIFKFTLEKLHAQMGTKFMIPIIGRRELDLHRLFVEVTSRGGFEKIVREKRWKEVTLAFNFPPTTTNASFMLQKYYSSLLFDYEQIYYFKATGLAPPTTFVFPHGQSFMPPPSQNKYSSQPRLGILPSLLRQTSYNAAELREGSPVIGVIDGKFESGYIVHVTIGAEKLQGVLYRAPQNTTSSASHPSLSVNKSNVSSPSGVTRRGRRKKSEVKRRGLDLPKSSRSSYNFFYSEEHARLKSLYHGKDRDMGKLGKVIGDLWSNLNKSEKSVYLKMAMKDKERYRKEMEDYHEKLKTGPVICDAVPLQQRLPYPETDMVDANADSYLTPQESSSSESDHQDGASIVKDIIHLDA